MNNINENTLYFVAGVVTTCILFGIIYLVSMISVIRLGNKRLEERGLELSKQEQWDCLYAKLIQFRGNKPDKAKDIKETMDDIAGDYR